MERAIERKLVLEDGQIYGGFAFGAASDRVCELVFNTSMAGYQEIMSDPSYTDQAVVFTYPLIGNYGMAADDYETDTPTVGALVVREYNDSPSNFRSLSALDEVMRRYGIPGICGRGHAQADAFHPRLWNPSGAADGCVHAACGRARVLQSTPTRHDAVSRVSCRERRTQEPARDALSCRRRRLRNEEKHRARAARARLPRHHRAVEHARRGTSRPAGRTASCFPTGRATRRTSPR